MTKKIELAKTNQDLQSLINIGPTIAKRLYSIEINTPSQLKKSNPEKVYEKLKQNKIWKNIPTVFLTARTDETAEKAGRFLGDGYIEKPFDSEDFRIKIKQFLKD